MTARSEYIKEPWNREKSDLYISELENTIEKLEECIANLENVIFEIEMGEDL